MNKKLISIIVILILIFVISINFYSNEFRPAQARKECDKTVTSELGEKGSHSIDYWKKSYDLKFQSCLNSKGIK